MGRCEVCKGEGVRYVKVRGEICEGEGVRYVKVKV